MENQVTNESVEYDLQFNPTHDENQMKTIYTLGLQIHEVLKGTQNMAWPPTPDVCTDVYAQSLVAPVLYNLIAWVITENVDFSEKRVKLDEATHIQVLSICQDILFASRHGRTLTPKHDCVFGNGG